MANNVVYNSFNLKVSDKEIKDLVRYFEKENSVIIFWDYEPMNLCLMFCMRRGNIWTKTIRVPYSIVTIDQLAITLNKLYEDLLEKRKKGENR